MAHEETPEAKLARKEDKKRLKRQQKEEASAVAAAAAVEAQAQAEREAKLERKKEKKNKKRRRESEAGGDGETGGEQRKKSKTTTEPAPVPAPVPTPVEPDDEAERKRRKAERKAARKAKDAAPKTVGVVERPASPPAQPPAADPVEVSEEERKRRKKEKKAARKEAAAAAEANEAVVPEPAVVEPLSEKKKGKKRQRDEDEPSTAATSQPAPPAKKVNQPVVDLDSLTEEELLAFLRKPKSIRSNGATASTSSPRTVAATSASSRKKISKSPKASHKISSTSGLDAADVLATKWMGPKDLKAFADENNITLKMGAYSPSEEVVIDQAIASYSAGSSFSPSDLTTLLATTRRPEADSPFSRDHVAEFWTHVSRSVPLRPISSVYAHVRRVKHPLYRQGAWRADEEDLLRAAIKDLGQSAWKDVSERVGRLLGDCRDHWRNEMGSGGEILKGPWDEAEIKKLTKAVGKLGENWQAVSKRVGRTAHQCGEKWRDGAMTWRKDDAAAAEKLAAASDTRKDTSKSLAQKHRSNFIIAIASLKPRTLDEVAWDKVLELEAEVLKGRTERRLKTEFENLLVQALEEGEVKTFKDQLAWLSDRYPDKGRCRSAASAAKLVRRRNLKEEKREATAAVKAAKKPRASVKEKKSTSEPKTKSVKTEFKSAEMISSSDEEDDE